MEQAKYPSATIRYNENLFAIEYFKTYLNEAERGNPYNTTFSIRVVSGAFCGYASCEYDIKEFSRFVNEMEEIYSFKRSKAELNDICYGSKVIFCFCTVRCYINLCFKVVYKFIVVVVV